jgi:hypothetical protein
MTRHRLTELAAVCLLFGASCDMAPPDQPADPPTVSPLAAEDGATPEQNNDGDPLAEPEEATEGPAPLSNRESCTAGFFQSCTTAAIRAHPSRHRIYVGFQDPWSIIEVFDVTGARVYRSETGWTPKFGRHINGLYNWYYLKLTARDVILVDAEIISQ